VVIGMGCAVLQGVHDGRLGGQEEGRGVSGHWVRSAASLRAGSTRVVVCAGWGLRTATPLLKESWNVVCR